MKKIFVKANILPVAVLCAICLVVAALMGLVNSLTAPVIEDRENREANAALLQVLPEANNFKEITDLTGYPKEIKKAHSASLGYVFQVETKGKETLSVMVGIFNDGTVSKVKVLNENETPGFKEAVLNNVQGDNGKYNGMSGETLDKYLVSGSTLTSNGIYNAVNAALKAYKIAIGGATEPDPSPEEPGEGSGETDPKDQFARPDSELLALAAQLVEGAEGFDKLEVEGDNDYLISLFKEKSGKGFVAYIMTIAQYGNVESEELVYISNDGKIADVMLLTWKVSDPIYGYVPPTTDEVNAFYNRLIDLDIDTISSVELVTNATNTSTVVVNSFIEALEAAEEHLEVQLPTEESKLLDYGAELFGGSAEFEVCEGGGKYLLRVWRETSGKGYLAYVVVISENYGTVETEELIKIGSDGAIADVKLLKWKVSDPIYGYVPPEQDLVDAFYDRLIGKTSENVSGVELVSNATNTSGKVIDSFVEALTCVDLLIKNELPTPESDLKNFAAQLADKAVDLENVTSGGGKNLLRLYRDKNGAGYFAYVVVISEQYGTIETEELIRFSKEGKILGVKLITWKVSDPIYGYVPPTQDTVNAFYTRLVGATPSSIDGVELVTNATNTSGNVIASIKEAMAAVANAARFYDSPKADDAVLDLAGQLVGGTPELEDVTPAIGKYLYRLYKDKASGSYVAYLVIYSEGYGTVESEALLHISESGKIIAAKKIVWKTSDAIFGYVPPTQADADAFYTRLAGATLETIDGVELVTNATNTSAGLINAVKEALTEVCANYVPKEEVTTSYTARIVGIVIASVALLGACGYVVVSKKMRGGKTDEK